MSCAEKSDVAEFEYSGLLGLIGSDCFLRVSTKLLRSKAPWHLVERILSLRTEKISGKTSDHLLINKISNRHYERRYDLCMRFISFCFCFSIPTKSSCQFSSLATHACTQFKGH